MELSCLVFRLVVPVIPMFADDRRQVLTADRPSQVKGNSILASVRFRGSRKCGSDEEQFRSQPMQKVGSLRWFPIGKGRVGPSGLTNRRLGIETQHRNP